VIFTVKIKWFSVTNIYIIRKCTYSEVLAEIRMIVYLYIQAFWNQQGWTYVKILSYVWRGGCLPPLKGKGFNHGYCCESVICNCDRVVVYDEGWEEVYKVTVNIYWERWKYEHWDQGEVVRFTQYMHGLLNSFCVWDGRFLYKTRSRISIRSSTTCLRSIIEWFNPEQ
jgi:hypothetical protein